MKFIKKILLAILVMFLLIQFFQPARNRNGKVLSADISNIYTIPEKVNLLLKNSCYDCHSNNTNYPWYSNVQPIGWFIANDIKNGKEKMNFSQWGILSQRKQKSRLQEIENIIKEEKMPLKSYKLLHKNARLSEEEKKIIYQWIEKTKDDILK